MFTGLVETIGTVRTIAGTTSRQLSVLCERALNDVAIGDSIAIDGCCLTVTQHDAECRGLHFDVGAETFDRTTLGHLQAGSVVNIERALRLSDRLGGHLMTGHIDGIGVVRERKEKGATTYVGIEASSTLLPYIASQGSVAVSGVSLTVARVSGDLFFVALIPHTRDATTLRTIKQGQQVNIEVDILARYVQRLLETRTEDKPVKPSLTHEFLKDKGFL